MMEIKKVDILSVAKLWACLVGGIYLAAGVIISLVVAILGIPAFKSFDILSLGSALLATLLVSMVMGAVCFIFGAIFAWLYNVFAKLIGGVKVELEPVENKIVKFKDLEKKSALKKVEKVKSGNLAQDEINKIIKDKPGDRDTFS